MCHLSKDKQRWQQTKGFRFDFNGSLIDQRGSTAKPPKRAKIIEPEPNIEFGTFIQDRQILLVLDLKLANEANSSEGWRVKNARHKKQKKKIFVEMLPVKHLIKMPCILKITRFAPKLLDRHDNLPYSAKWVNDQLCAEITGDLRPGRADDHDGFTFQYDQVKSKKYYVKIEISW